MQNNHSKPSAVKFVYVVSYKIFNDSLNTYNAIVKAYSRAQAQYLFYKYHSSSYNRVIAISESNTVNSRKEV